MSSLTSKQVDLKVFEEFSEAIGFTADLSELVYKMCQDFEDIDDCTDIGGQITTHMVIIGKPIGELLGSSRSI